MLRSVATSLAFLPLLISFITASQSTLGEGNGGRAANAVVRSIAEAAASANFLINIFFPRIEFRFVSNDAQYSKIHGSSKGGENRFPRRIRTSDATIGVAVTIIREYFVQFA